MLMLLTFNTKMFIEHLIFNMRTDIIEKIDIAG